jgi:hypothetical protein
MFDFHAPEVTTAEEEAKGLRMSDFLINPWVERDVG